MSRQLRIAMISYYLPSGQQIGVGYQVHALANELVLRGHSVTVFSSCAASKGANYATETVPLRGSNRTFKFALQLRKIDWSNFDVLHAHGDDYWLWRRRVPAHVRTLHGSCFSEAIRISGVRERLRMLALGLSEVLATAVADQTVAVSRNTRRWLPWVRTVIPNGVDLSAFRPGAHSSNPSIVFVGTYRNRKRGRLLMDVFEQEVAPRLPEAELWMVAEDAPARAGVRVFGRVSQAELIDLYQRAWVFCLPSTYEGFGIPYVEAMACGAVVVATPNPGSIEVTGGGRYGIVVDEAKLGAELVELMSSEGRRQHYEAVGLSRAADYDLSRVVALYEALYGRLIAGGARRRAGQSPPN